VSTITPHHALATAIRSLAAEKEPACLLDTRGTFLFVNEAWDRHASAAGGTLGTAIIGTRWLDHLQGEEVRRAHEQLLARALTPPHPRSLVQVGEANTGTRAALLSTRFEPVLQHGEPLGVRVVNTVVRERPIEEVYDVVHRPTDAYRQADGAIVQCSCCRRVQDPGEPERWDLVPELLQLPVASRHALCELCAELHYRPCCPP
jgi:hypothetical protein